MYKLFIFVKEILVNFLKFIRNTNYYRLFIKKLSSFKLRELIYHKN